MPVLSRKNKWGIVKDTKYASDIFDTPNMK